MKSIRIKARESRSAVECMKVSSPLTGSGPLEKYLFPHFVQGRVEESDGLGWTWLVVTPLFQVGIV